MVPCLLSLHLASVAEDILASHSTSRMHFCPITQERQY